MTSEKWWKEAIVYQIYARSFKDSNGDGIGDLNGILTKIDYLSWLRIDAICLNPIFDSPNENNGYDTSDYYTIHTEYGKQEDFDDLLQALHEQGVKLILDIVVNHTSNEHYWFQEAKKSRENIYYRYYLWWPEEDGEPPERESFFDNPGKGWTYNLQTNSWYLHYFSPAQPDLNWENPAVRKEIHNIFRFWLQKGVDGFRLHDISFISKDIHFPKITKKIIEHKYQGEWSHYYAQGPRLHEFLNEMRVEVFDHFNAVIIGEAPGILAEHALSFVDPQRAELDVFTQFEGIGMGYVSGEFRNVIPHTYDMRIFKNIFSRWNDVFLNIGWGTIYLGNHDQPRMVSRWGNESPEYRKSSAKLLLTFLLSMRATPFIYNGDELGMTNISAAPWVGDDSRTPFPWTGDDGCGFSSAEPWISMDPNCVFINQEASMRDPDSILHYFKKLALFRHSCKTLVYGNYIQLNTEDALYGFIRSDEKARLLILLNFSDQRVSYIMQPLLVNPIKVLINNYSDVRINEKNLEMLPYQALIVDLS